MVCFIPTSVATESYAICIRTFIYLKVIATIERSAGSR